MIAVSMPGKTGDALYSIPSIRFLSEQHKCKADFYTSSHVERARDLFEYQDCINQLIIPHGYKIERYDIGIQPWNMPIDTSLYKCTFHLGYRRVPDKRLDWFMAGQVGIPENLLPKVYYDYPDLKDKFDLPDKFYLLAGNGDTTFRQTFVEFANNSDLPVVQIGLADHYLPELEDSINYTGISLLDTTYLLSRCSGFVGLQTNQLVIANGFNIPKVAPINNPCSWDMRHAIYSDSNFYPSEPSGLEILSIIKNYLEKSYA